jgi:hypothetical protein
MIKEKAIKKRTSVKGTVLFTVVCVMMVLVVFLMGTLTLAATANKRANFKYIRAQNEANARTVMESVVDAVANDSSTNGIRAAILSGPFDMTVTLDGRDYNVAVTKNGTRSWHDAAAGWVTGDVYNLTATVASGAGNEPVHYTASMVLGVQNTPNPNPNLNTGGKSGAFVSFGGIGGTIGTSGMTTGGTEIGLNGTGSESYTLDNYAAQELPFYVNGNLTTASGCYAQCNSLGDKANGVLSYLAITGDFTINNAGYAMEFDSSVKWDSSKSMMYYNIPSVYVGNKLEALSGNFSFGNDNVPVNIYAGYMVSDIHFFHRGDIFLFDDTKESVFNGSQGATKLYTWAERNMTMADGTTGNHKFGNLYSRGNVTFKLGNKFDLTGGFNAERQREGGNVTFEAGKLNNDAWTHEIDGDVRVAKRLKITGNNGGITIGGDAVAHRIEIGEPGNTSALHVGNDLYADELDLHGDLIVTGKVYAKHITGEGTITAAEIQTKSPITSADKVGGVTCVGTLKDGEKAYPKGDIYPDGYLQSDIVSKVLSVPSKSQYEAPTDYPSTLKEFNKKITVLNAAETDIAVDILTDDKVFWGTHEVVVGQHWDDYTNPYWPHWEDDKVDVTDSAHITDSCVLQGGFTKNIYIDTTGNQPGTNKSIAIICDDFSLQDGKSIIINENGGNVYFFVKKKSDTAGGDGMHQAGFTISGGSIITTDYIEKITGKKTTDAGYIDYIKNADFKYDNESLGTWDVVCRPAADSPDFPYVYIYGEENSAMDVGNNALIVANIRAPKMDYKQGTSAKVGGTVTHKGAVDTEYKDYIGIIGQLISNKIKVSNQWGLVFVEDPTANNNQQQQQNPIQQQNPNQNNQNWISNDGSIQYNIY